MMRVLLIALLLTSCTTFSDLGDHPFQGCPDDCSSGAEGACVCPAGECPDGTEQLPGGECAEPAETNNTNNTATNNNTSPTNVMPCPDGDPSCCDEPDAEGCCQIADGATCCDAATDECCAGNPNDPNCQPTTNNSNSVLLDDYALVIADVDEQACQDAGGNGADIFGVEMTLPDGERLLPYVLLYQAGEGGAGMAQVSTVIESDTTELSDQGCPQGESFALGCGGFVALSVENVAEFDVTQGASLRIFESGPQCDGAEDSYAVLVCLIDQLQAGDADGCLILEEFVQGNTQFDLPL